MNISDCRETHFFESIHLKRDINTVACQSDTAISMVKCQCSRDLTNPAFVIYLCKMLGFEKALPTASRRVFITNSTQHAVSFSMELTVGGFFGSAYKVENILIGP